jgi:multicomponent Na+:H+ antiporter subunit E
VSLAARARSALVRAAWLAAGWWALIEGDPAGLAFGLPVVVLATVASLRVRPPGHERWHPLGVARLVGSFLAHSLQGGLDVAARALAPRLPLAPVMLDYQASLPPGPALSIFMGALSLMPGTLAVDAHGAEVKVHALADDRDALRRQLAALEARVAGALTAPPSGVPRA